MNELDFERKVRCHRKLQVFLARVTHSDHDFSVPLSV